MRKGKMVQKVDSEGLQIDYRHVNEGLQVDHRFDGLQVAYAETGPEASNYKYCHPQTDSDTNSMEGHARDPQKGKLVELPVLPNRVEKQTIWKIRRRWFWLAVVSTLVILAAIAGGVAGGIAKTDRKSTGVPTTTPPAASAPPTDTTASIRENSKLAAVAFNDTNGILQYRVYYQDASDNIKESSWNASSKTWYVSNESIVKAQPNSPIAAAATGLPEFPSPQINLYTLDSSSLVNEWIINPSSSSSTWSSGSLNDANIQAANNSNLAAISHSHPGCFGCYNETVIVYEDASNTLNVGLGNSSGWSWATLSSATSVAGTGLAFCLKWYPNGTTTGIRVFYESPGGIQWFSWDADGNATDPAFTNWEYRKTFQDSSLNGSIAAFSYGTNVTTGYPLNFEILSSSSHGVTNYPWLGTSGDGIWESPQEPSSMESLDAYANLAANQDGRAYGMQSGVIKEFMVSTDGESQWTLVGDVVTA